MQAADGKFYQNDAADTEAMFRIIQTIPSTTEISEVKKPDTFHENRKVAREGGGVARKARKEIEARTGRKVVSKDNFLTTPQSLKKLEKK